jgi:hypothetical protein
VKPWQPTIAYRSLPVPDMISIMFVNDFCGGVGANLNPKFFLATQT